MSRSREPLLDVVARHSKRELSRHPNSGGWVEEWEPIDEWGKHVPLQLLPRAGRLAMDRLIRLGLVETDGRTMIRLAAGIVAADLQSEWPMSESRAYRRPAEDRGNG